MDIIYLKDTDTSGTPYVQLHLTTDLNFVIPKLLPKSSQHTISKRHIPGHGHKHGRNSTLLYKLPADIGKTTAEQDVQFHRLTGSAPPSEITMWYKKLAENLIRSQIKVTEAYHELDKMYQTLREEAGQKKRWKRSFCC